MLSAIGAVIVTVLIVAGVAGIAIFALSPKVRETVKQEVDRWKGESS